MEENNKNVATNRQIGLYLGEFSYKKGEKTVRVVEVLVWQNRTADNLTNPQIIRLWDYQGAKTVNPFDTVVVDYEYVEGYKGVYKKYLGYEKYEKGVSAK